MMIRMIISAVLMPGMIALLQGLASAVTRPKMYFGTAYGLGYRQ